MNIPNYISPEAEKDVEELMQPLRDATTREERDEARKKINEEVSGDSQSAWLHVATEPEEEEEEE